MEQFIANGLCKGSVYALVALGFGLIYSTSGVFHIAHGFVYAASAYVVFWCTSALNLPAPLSVGIAFCAAAVLGIIIEYFVYRPLTQKNASSSILMISSFGTYIIGVNLIALLFGNDSRILGTAVEKTFHIGGATLTRIQCLQFTCGVVIFLLYLLFLRCTSFGRICRAVADDPALASVLGVRVEATRMLAFALGSVFAAVGAVLIAFDVGMEPYIGLPMVLSATVACILGGLYRFLAPAFGGVLLGVLQSLVVSQTAARWETTVTFSILIFFLLFRPQGLWGRAQRLEDHQ